MNLKEYLEAYGIPQAQAAKSLGLSTTHISRLVSGGSASLKLIKKVVVWSGGEVAWDTFGDQGRAK